jgi:hypothetical protein
MPIALLRHGWKYARYRRALLITGRGRPTMGIGTILFIVVVLLLVGALPTWGYSSGWGYGPSGGLGLVLVILLILLLLGKI